MLILSYEEADKRYRIYMNTHGYGIDDIRKYPEMTLAVGDYRGSNRVEGEFLYHNGEKVYICEKYDWYRKSETENEIYKLLKQGMNIEDVFSFVDL